MRCEDCQGTGRVRHELREPVVVAERAQGAGMPPVFIEVLAIRLPCESCGGSGWAHCCEGERPN